jgi:hypothetical protein
MNFPYLSPAKNSELCHLTSSNSLTRVLLPLLFLSLSDELRTPNSLIQLRDRHWPTVNTYHVIPTHCCSVMSLHTHKLMDRQETCHMTATYCWCVMSPLVLQLALLLRARIVFTEMLPFNTLIRYATVTLFLLNIFSQGLDWLFQLV